MLILGGPGSYVGNVTQVEDYYNFLRTKVHLLMDFLHFINFCFQIFDMLLNGDLYPYKPYFYNVTKTNNYYNFLETEVNSVTTILYLYPTTNAILFYLF
jgi:hypothetical protein